jgi:1,2-diacylglycerol 3-alpha-glucosyltransferase
MTGSPLTLALVVAAPFPALQGSQVLVRQLAEGLARRGHRVHLVAYSAESRAVKLEDVVVHSIPRLWGCQTTTSGPHPGKVFLDILLTAKLSDVVRRERVDVLHAHNYEAAIASLIVGRLAGRPVVYHGHSAMADELPTYFSSSFARLLAVSVGRWLDGNVPRRADYCIGVTDDLVNLLLAQGVSADGVKCVTPASPEVEEVDGRAAAYSGKGFGGSSGPVLLYAGNLDGYQNLEFLLRSFVRIRALRPDTCLLVVTHGEGRRYRRRARDLGREAVCVVKVRSFPEAWALIEAADIAVCPRTETTGFPMKLLNYMAAGKAIVACEGSAKVLRHGETGMVVPDGDEAAFAAAVLALLDHPTERQRLGAGARRAVRDLCCWETMVDRVEGIYRRVLARRGAESRRRSVATVGLLK